jgi:hypothetical protein
MAAFDWPGDGWHLNKKEVSPFSHSRHPIFHVYGVGMEIYYEFGKHI